MVWVVFSLLIFFDCYAVTLGIEQISNSFLQQLLGKKKYSVGLVANQTSRVTKSKSSLNFLLYRGVPISAIFVPEHGYYGVIEAEGTVSDQVEKKTGIPIISLFDRQKKKSIDAALFDDVNCLIFDLQDIGMRHYTYISLLYRIMQSLANTNKWLIVCDRPNPLGGMMEGPLVACGLESYISIAPIPLKHGMTVGELALYFNRFFFKGRVLLSVIPLKEYGRLPNEYSFLAPLSPNVKSKRAIYGYSFLGLVGEMKPFDVGVGTRNSFSLIGLPEHMLSSIGWKKIELLLLENGIQSNSINYYNKSAKKRYEGLSITINDPTTINTGTLIAQLIKLANEYKVVLTYGPYADHAFGSKAFQSGTFFSLKKQIQQETEAFNENAKSIFLYKPHPVLVGQNR